MYQIRHQFAVNHACIALRAPSAFVFSFEKGKKMVPNSTLCSLVMDSTQLYYRLYFVQHFPLRGTADPTEHGLVVHTYRRTDTVLRQK